MATVKVTFTCAGGNCIATPSPANVNQGDTVEFDNQTAGILQVWNLPAQIFVNHDKFDVPAGGNESRDIKPHAPLHVEYQYDFKSLACPGDNDQGKFIVDD